VIKYRPDIDGLRTIAVVPVVLYHFGIAAFGGGYVGVDVFFVISGFLIGRSVIEGIKGSTFSFVDFAERRIRRLYPALLATLLVSTAAGFLILLPVDLRALGESVIATLAYVSNIHFYREVGYFDAGAINKPLLHTWSLAVEEQFYIFLPLAAWLLFRLRLPAKAVYATLSILAALSFAAAVLMVHRDQPAAFFLFPFRLWEMALGVAAAYLPARLVPKRYGTASLLAIVGVALILMPVFLYSHDTLFPGLSALPPCVGAALIILAGERAQNLAMPVLTSRPFVVCGLLSYSLYLWHWPVVVYLSYWYGEDFALPQQLAGLALTGALAYLSWRWIEKPFRKRGFPARRTLFASAAALSTAFAFLGVFMWRSDGVPQRYTAEQRQLATAAGDFHQAGGTCDEGPIDLRPGLHVCRIGVPDREPKVLIWGDSHARALRDGIHASAIQNGESALLVWQGGCPPLVGVRKREKLPLDDEACFRSTQKFLGWLAKEPELRTVMLIGRWAYYTEGSGVGIDVKNRMRIWDAQRGETAEPADAVFRKALRRTVMLLSNQGRDVIVLQPIPEIPGFSARTVAQNALTGHAALPDELRKRAYVSREAVARRQAASRKAIDELAREKLIRTIDLADEFCNARVCSAWQDGRLAYFDNNHLTVTSSIAVRSNFDGVFVPRREKAKAAAR
jgi:peptidoglycan/LPS O-acetylase OafA/YrhL